MRSEKDIAGGIAPRPATVLYWEGNTDGTIGGSQVFMHDLITHLDRQKFLPIAGFAQDNPIADELRKKGVETYVRSRPAPVNLRTLIGESTRVRRAMVTILMPLQRLANVWRRFLLPALLHAIFLRRRRIDLIDLNNSITRNHELMLASLLAGVKCITHEAGINPEYSRGSRYFHRRVKAIVCCSEAIANNMRAHGLDHPLLPTVYSCVSDERMEVRESSESVRARIGLTSQTPIIGVVGNVKEWKGQEIAIRATALLTDHWPGIACVLVGKVGPESEDYYQRLQAICRDARLVGRVFFVGYQPHPVDFMNIMDVVVHCSINPEPFGMTNLEAMSLGKPVVSTNCGGPVEVFEDGVSGVLVPPGDPVVLAAAVDALLQDPVMARRIGEAGRRRREERFRLADTVAKTENVYRLVLAGR